MIGSALKSPALLTGKQLSHKVARITAPMGGVNVTLPIGSQDLNFCPYSYNLCPKESGMAVRNGYTEWCVDLVESPATAEGSEGVRTIVPFQRSLAAGVNSKLFAVTNEGIWDVTTEDTPTQSLSFSTRTGEAGYGVYTHYVTDAGVEYLFYADSVNGLFTYTASSGVWAAATGITGVTIADINFIAVHKQRIWLGIESSTDGWYLPVGAIAGAAAKFSFGSKFKHGGTLKGLFNWTVDGGTGVDDYLVAVSSAGDVLPYAGDDPTATNWVLRGSFFIGQVPNSVRFGTITGGELYLLCANGVISMNDLLQGVDSNILQANASEASLTYRISAVVRQAAIDKIDIAGWEIAAIPSEGGILILAPLGSSSRPLQYYFNGAVKAWSFWRDLPMTAFDTFNNLVFFGTADSRIVVMDTSVDNVQITPADPDNNGLPIEHSIITYFSALGAEGVYKRPRLIRPDYLSSEAPDSQSVCRYDFDLTESATNPLDSPIALPVTGGLWDTGEWDTAVWGGVSIAPINKVKGLWGYGRYIAIATKGETTEPTVFVGWDLVYDVGGVMY